ncbi:MAG: HlyC/CorC family transporter [Bacteroidales bacterium]|nr:HlyC/CorC family transporter [Bacteroidales bacterium]
MGIWFALAITIIFSAFFSGMEIAFISSSKLKVELDKGKGMFSAHLLAYFNKIPSRFIGALLLGNNIALVFYGIYMSQLLEPFLHANLPALINTELSILLIQTIFSTLIILILSEFLPKVIFKINPNATLNSMALPVTAFYFLFYPFIFIYTEISSFFIRKLLRLNITEKEVQFGFADLQHYFKEYAEGDENGEMQSEIQMLQNAMEFRKVRLRECIIPRTEIEAIEKGDSLDQLKQKFIKTGFSRILVYNESIDDIVGYVHSSDLFKDPKNISAITRTVPIVPETMLAHDILSLFTQQNKNLALVVDEFGGTAGIVTLEDILEEILGEIVDEYDDEDLEEKQLEENEYIFSSRLEIDYLNDEYNLGLPESDEYETLGGLILKYHESIPKKDDVIIIESFNFKILQATESKIEKVKLNII